MIGLFKYFQDNDIKERRDLFSLENGKDRGHWPKAKNREVVAVNKKKVLTLRSIGCRNRLLKGIWSKHCHCRRYNES